MVRRSSSPQMGTKSCPSAPRPCNTMMAVRGLGAVSISWVGSMGFPVFKAQFKALVAMGVQAFGQRPPAGPAVEGLGAGVGLRAQVQPAVALGEQPVHHHIVQQAAVAAAVHCRVHEHRPDVAVARVADREAGDAAGRQLDHPAAAVVFQVGMQLGVRDAAGREGVFGDGVAHAPELGRVVAGGLSKQGHRVIVATAGAAQAEHHARHGKPLPCPPRPGQLWRGRLRPAQRHRPCAMPPPRRLLAGAGAALRRGVHRHAAPACAVAGGSGRGLWRGPACHRAAGPERVRQRGGGARHPPRATGVAARCRDGQAALPAAAPGPAGLDGR
mmetsp:Transcript_10016/g.40720  ORF Transcript_10016/g.40720 Transcript_10016/m.40720 type:complete len:328 (+) Transcript_10016:418-1401(+)